MANFDTHRFTPSREGLGGKQARSIGDPLDCSDRPYADQDKFNTTWASPEDLIGYLVKHTDNGRRWYSGIHNVNAANHEWAWCFQTTHSLAMARTGWKAGSATVGSAHVDVANTYLAEHTEETHRHDVTGAFVDVAAYLSGEPECMIDFCEEKRETRSVKILVDSFISCGTDGDTAFLRGTAIMAAVLAAQSSGLAVTVEMAAKMNMARYNGGQIGTYRLTVHRPGDTLDTSKLAYYLAHPAFLRNVFIQAALLTCGATGGTGDARTLCNEEGPGIVYVPGMLLDHHPWGSAESNKILIEKIFSAAR